MMNPNKLRRQNSSNKFNIIKKFKVSLNKLSQNQHNLDLQTAIRSWCIELSLEDFSPLIDKNVNNMSKTIVNLVNSWLTENTIIELTVKMFAKLLKAADSKLSHNFGNFVCQISNNINEENLPIIIEKAKKTISTQETEEIINVAENTQNNIPVKSMLLIAFVFTGIGLLLLILKNKSETNESSGVSVSNAKNESPLSYIREKHVLVLLIKSDRYQELINSLRNNSYLELKNASKLYGATQGLWIGTKSKFDRTQIKQELMNCQSIRTKSEYDVNFITIKLDKDDSRFYPYVNPMDRRDAFIELSKRSPQVTVSPRLSCKAYENTEFYSR